jgi:hypothetical protein
MRLASSLRVAALAGAAGMLIVSPARGQTLSSAISTTLNVTLKSFTPVDSFFVNPTATSFSIALVHVVSGSPTEYRVSRFSDFRDASWKAVRRAANHHSPAQCVSRGDEWRDANHAVLPGAHKEPKSRHAHLGRRRNDDSATRLLLQRSVGPENSVDLCRVELCPN